MVRKIKSYNFKFDYNMFQNDVIAFVEAYQLKHTDVDNLAGVGNGTTSKIIRGEYKNHKMETWLGIANAMDIDVRTYFVLDV